MYSNRDSYEKEKVELTTKVSLIMKKIIQENVKDMSNEAQDFMNLLLNKREKRANKGGRLRDIIVSLVLKINGINNLSEDYMKIISAGELYNIASYYQNWLLDDKSHLETIKNGAKNSDIAGHFFRELAQKTILNTGLPEHTKLNLIFGLGNSNYAIQKGQSLELNDLTFENHFKKLLSDKNYKKELIERYVMRCFGFSGEFYGYSFSMGAILADKNKEIIEKYMNIGRIFGVGLQMINDVGDFSLEKDIANNIEKDYQDQFADLEKGTMTLPLIELGIKFPKLEEYAGRKLSNEEKELLFKKMIEFKSFDLSRKFTNMYMRKIRLLLRELGESDYKDSLKQIISTIFESNKFYKNLTKTHNYKFEYKGINYESYKTISGCFLKDTNADLCVLIDENDNEIGQEEKLKTHQLGLLHRAFSVLIFNSKGELLLQQRAKEKYHCGGLWTNTVCSHPRPGESYENAVHRRLKEEFGFDCDIEFKFNLRYKASFENGLIENEFDKVFIGYYNGSINPNQEEIMAYKRANIKNIKKDIKANSKEYTERFKLIIKKQIAPPQI